MILTSYLYVGLHYRKKNGRMSEVAPIGIVTLWIQVVMTNCYWKQWTVVEHGAWAVVHCFQQQLPDDDVDTPKHVGVFD
jgi:hypothetical protein